MKEFIEKEKKRVDKFRIPTTVEIDNAHRYAVVDTKVYLMLPNFSNEYNVSDEVKDKFMAHGLMKKEAFSTSPIERITGIKHVQFINSEIMYTIYEVQRKDKQKQYFCDNDLLSINPSDLITLGKRMKTKMNEGKHPQDKIAFERILRCMEAFVKHRRQTDFQVGMDHNVSDLSISAPNEQLEEIEKLPCGKLLSEPEEGAIFRRPGRKCFFRVNEAHKYSAGIIELIKGYASIQKEEIQFDANDRALAEKIFKKLETVQNVRKLTDQFQKIIIFKPDAPF